LKLHLELLHALASSFAVNHIMTPVIVTYRLAIAVIILLLGHHNCCVSLLLQLDLAELERQFPDSGSSKKGKPKKPAAPKSKPGSKGGSKPGSATASMDEGGRAAAAKNGNGSSSNGSASASVSVDQTYEEPDPVPAGERHAGWGPGRECVCARRGRGKLEPVCLHAAAQQACWRGSSACMWGPGLTLAVLLALACLLCMLELHVLLFWTADRHAAHVMPGSSNCQACG
jgi:hypothetical protein